MLQPARPSDPDFLARLREIAPGLLPGHRLRCADPADRRSTSRPAAGSTCTSRSCPPGAARRRCSTRSCTATTSPAPPRSGSSASWTPGPVYGVLTEPIRPSDTAGDLLDRLSIAGAELLVATLDGIESGELEAREQPADGVSLAPKITAGGCAGGLAQARRRRSSRLIRACTPEPGAWTELDGVRVKLWPVQPAARGAPALALGWRARPAGARRASGAARPRARRHRRRTPVELGDVQADGKRRMSAADWARGLHLAAARSRPADGARAERGQRIARPAPRRGERRRASAAAAPRPRRSGPAGRTRRAAGRGRPGRLRQPAAAAADRAARARRPGRRAGHRADATARCAAGAATTRCSPSAATATSTSLDPVVREVLRLGTHQLLATRIQPHAAVATSVDLVKDAAGQRPAGFVNAVLRRVASQGSRRPGWRSPRPAGTPTRPGHLAVRYSHPRWIVEAFAAALGEAAGGTHARDRGRAGRRQRAPGRPPVRGARPGRTGRAGRGRLRAGAVVGVRRLPGRGRSGRDRRGRRGPGRRAGRGQPARRRRARPRAARGRRPRWLDLCAGPGGKARLLAGLAAGAGARLVAGRDPRAPGPAGAVAAVGAPGRSTGVIVADGTGLRWAAGLRPGHRRRAVLRARRAAPPAGGALAARARRTSADLGGLQRAPAARRAGRRPARRRRRLRDLLAASGRDQRTSWPTCWPPAATWRCSTRPPCWPRSPTSCAA